MYLNEIANEIHENAKAHGWWDEERSVGEIIALCHSELSEALEAYRNGEPMEWDNNGKPDGIAVEMIDCVIRVFDYLAKENINIDRILKDKHEYNKKRPYKHGNKVI
jgi:NTP pyrophosphatase (non-canonical NTP hydrolase)